MTIEILDTLPAYQLKGFPDTPKEVGATLWSGKEAPPAIGALVYVGVNRIGWGVVKGYFIESGWLGVSLELEGPPDWWIKQNGGLKTAMVFGAEIESDGRGAPGGVQIKQEG